MSAIKQIRKLIAADPAAPAAQLLTRLVIALESGQPYAIAELYELDYDRFELALELVRDWRLHRHYTAKGKLLEVAAQFAEVRH